MNQPHIINASTILKPDAAFATSMHAEYKPTMQVADAMSPKDLLSSILRNKWLITGVVASILVFTYFLLSITSPRYTSDALLMIKSYDGSVVNPTSEPSPTISNESIQNEIELIKSRTLAVKVIKLLHLDRDPNFNSFFKDDESGFETLNTNRYLSDLEEFSSGEYPDSYDPTEARQADDLLKAYYDGLSVTRKGISQVIHIEYSAKDPVTAKNIVGAISDQYIQQQRDMKYREAGKASELLFERIKPLQKKVEESETAVENFRKKSGLLESRGITLTSQQLAELNNQLIQAEKNHDEARARFNQIDRLINTPQGAGTISAVRQSPLIQQLRMKEVELQQKLSDFLTVYRPRHPTMIQLRAEMKDLSDSLDKEMLNIKNSLDNEAVLARKQKQFVRQRLSELKDEVAKSNKASVKLRALEREAEANRNLFEIFLSRFKSASTQQDMDVQQPNAQILSRAFTPVDPSFPKKGLILALAFVGSVILAVIFVIIRESMDRGFYTTKLIEEYTGVPSLGYIPTIRKKDARGKYPESYQVRSPQSSFAEAIRTLYSSIILSSPKPIKSILITSAQPKEGKTTIANTLAMSRSLAGQKTIIIDTDFRRANDRKTLKIKPSPGLAGFLNGDIALAKVIRKDARTGAHLIPAGSLIQNPTDLLMSHNMNKLIKVLNKKYDLIIFDSPPVLDAPNARILIQKVDATVLVTKWNSTKKQFIREALRRIAIPGHNIAGVLLNMVDEKKQIGYRTTNYTYDQLPQKQKLISTSI